VIFLFQFFLLLLLRFRLVFVWFRCWFKFNSKECYYYLIIL
jgi:hypothetical protein